MTTKICMRFRTLVLLLVLAVLGWTQARPHREVNQPMMMRFCGNELTLVIGEVCTAQKSPTFIDPLFNESTGNELNQRAELDDKKSDSRLRQCCVIGCTVDDLATFCRTDRNQIREVAIRLRSEDLDVDWLYEFIPRYGYIHSPE